ncbi:MAG: fused MFS/spermidine synthase [Alphaproteobacteria bacterium]|nr:fused MFS/spermidine synthase [Alphaproteobacteria bacterium]
MKNKNNFIPLLLIFITGYVSLSLELMVLRQVAHFVGSTAAISSIVIGIFLGAMTIGYFVGTKKFKMDIYKTVGLSFLAIAVLTILACSFPLISNYFYLMYAGKIQSPIIQTFIYSFVFLSIAPFLFGFNTAALSQVMHDKERSNTGIIMGIGTIGSVLGSLVTTLVFMALLGVNYTIMLTVVLAGVGAYLAYRKTWVLVISIAAFMMAWFFNNDSVLYKNYGLVSNNAENTVLVARTMDGGRVLLVDSATHSYISKDGKTAAEYINYINWHFINTIPADQTKDILVLGAGGFTVGNLDERNRYTFVDIDKALPEIAEKHFLRKKLSNNKKFVVQDAGQFLRAAGADYDLIVMDVFSRWSIPETMITTEFMSSMKSKLRPGGVIVMNTIGSANFGDEYSKKLDNTIRTVYPNNLTRQLVGDYNGWESSDYVNVLYIFHNTPNSGKIYNANKNSVIYD